LRAAVDDHLRAGNDTENAQFFIDNAFVNCVDDGGVRAVAVPAKIDDFLNAVVARPEKLSDPRYAGVVYFDAHWKTNSFSFVSNLRILQRGVAVTGCVCAVPGSTFCDESPPVCSSNSPRQYSR